MTLREHIDKSGKKPYVWARDNGIHHTFVYRHMSGKPVSYDTALRLSKATGDKVKADAIYRVGRAE